MAEATLDQGGIQREDMVEGSQTGAARAVETDPSHRYSRFDEILGRGAFKTVYKAFDEVEGIEVAWNQVKVTDIVTSAGELDRLTAEIDVLKQLKHKNIMTFYQSWFDKRNYTINFITELFTSGTLRQYRKKHKHIDDTVLKRWAWQIVQGLVYLHGHEPAIVHRDLKCDNIFVNGTSGVIKIGDLGLATMQRNTSCQSVLGTPEFMAPELYEEKYDQKVDVYSFGMCLLELATMEYPYCECKNAAQIYKKVTSGMPPASLAKVESTELREFVEMCIVHDPKRRPEARQLLKHCFFDSIRNSDKLAASAVNNDSRKDRLVTEVTESRSGSPTRRDRDEDAAGDGQRRLPKTTVLNVNDLKAQVDQEALQAPGAAGTAAVLPAANGVAAPAAALPPAVPAAPPLQPPALPAQPPAAALPVPAPLREPSPPLQAVVETEPLVDDNVRLECLKVEVSMLTFVMQLPPSLNNRKVEFKFDMDHDSADSVANEMVEDLALSSAQAAAIASQIQAEIARLKQSDALPPRPPKRVSDDSPPTAAAAAALRTPSLASHASSKSLSGNVTPGGDLSRPPSYHEIVRAMQEHYTRRASQQNLALAGQASEANGMPPAASGAAL